MRRGVAIKKAPVQTKLPLVFPKRVGTRGQENPFGPRPKSFREYLNAIQSEMNPELLSLLEQKHKKEPALAERMLIEGLPFSEKSNYHPGDEKSRKATTRRMSRYNPRIYDPANTVYMTRLKDLFADRNMEDIPQRYKDAVFSALSRGKKVVNPNKHKPKPTTQTTLAQMIPELTTEDPYDEEGRIRPGAIAPITAIKQIGRKALPNLRAYGLTPGITPESISWERDGMDKYSMIPAKQGTSFVAPVDNLNSIDNTMEVTGSGRPMYIGIRGFAQPEDKAFIRTDNREGIEAAALGTIPPERLVFPFSHQQAGKDYGPILSFEDYINQLNRYYNRKESHLNFEDYLAERVGKDRAKRMVEEAGKGNIDAQSHIKELRDMHERDLDMRRDEFELGKDESLNKVIRTNLVNQRLEEIDPKAKKQTMFDDMLDKPQSYIHGERYGGPFNPVNVDMDSVNTARIPMQVQPPDWQKYGKFNLMNPTLSEQEKELIRNEFNEQLAETKSRSYIPRKDLDRKLLMRELSSIYGPLAFDYHKNRSITSTARPTAQSFLERNFNQGLMSGPTVSSAENFKERQEDWDRMTANRLAAGQNANVQYHNPVAVSLGLPNAWNTPQIFNPNFDPNQDAPGFEIDPATGKPINITAPPSAMVQKARPQTYNLRDFGGIASEIKGFRWIPSHHIETAGKAVPVVPSRDRRPGTTYGWEEDLQRMKLGFEPISQGRKHLVSKPKPLPGLFTDEAIMDYRFGEFDQPKIPTPVATPRKIAGQFMSPPVLEALANPDVVPSSRGIDAPFSLLGVLESPHVTRSVEQGSGGVGEGYHYGELGADDVIHIPTAGYGPEGMMGFLDKYKTHDDLEMATGLSRGQKDLANILQRVPTMGDKNITEGSQAFLQQGAQDMNLDQLINAGLVQAGEPMDIAMQLLKNDWERDYFFQTARDSGIPEHEIEEAWLNSQNFTPPILPGDPNNLHPGDEGELEAATEGGRVYFPTTKVSREASPGIRRVVRHDDPSVGTFRDTPFNESTYFTTGEPMDIAMRLLKREMSPEAREHKLEYDKKYESSPERVKYREELNRERRKRGIYGSGDHMDVSHTEGGKLTLEREHENRARHFKERGTLRPSKIAVRKDN